MNASTASSTAIHDPGRDPLRDSVIDIWRNFFEKPDLAANDDFFDLGGDSLKAILLVGLCNSRFGTALAANILIENPTATTLARVIADESKNRKPTHVVTLREGGGKPPLLLIHPVGGSLFCYADLISQLPADRPIYGIEAAGLEPGERLAGSMEEMAAQYRQAFASTGTEHPWHLAGWSFGGLVAFEIARQLAESGQSPASVVLIDTPLPTARLAENDRDLVVAAAALQVERRRLAPEGGMPGLEAVLAATTQSRNAGLSAEAANRIAALVRHSLALRGSYRPRSLRAGLTVIRASAEPVALPEDYDWAKHAQSGVTRFDIEATHEAIVRPPHAESVAAILQRAMAAGDAKR